jgi:hypothetical protein
MTAHLYALSEEWALWRCVAVRAAGFPASGIELLAGDKDYWACAAATCCASQPLTAVNAAWPQQVAISTRSGGLAAGRTGARSG